MFIKNDSSPEKRYYNGKIGIITAISRENVTVQCANEIDEIVTEKEQWDTVNYSIDEKTKELKEDIVGSFSQIPLRLAWAITMAVSAAFWSLSRTTLDCTLCSSLAMTEASLLELGGVGVPSIMDNAALAHMKNIASGVSGICERLTRSFEPLIRS